MCDIGPDHCPDVYGPFVGWDASLFPISPPNKPDSLKNAISDAVSDVSLYQTIRTMFSETEKTWEKAREFHHHPVTRMLVNYMQKTLTWEWDRKPVKNTLFPNLNEANSPASLPGADETLRNGAVALAVKALYNGGGGNTVRPVRFGNPSY